MRLIGMDTPDLTPCPPLRHAERGDFRAPACDNVLCLTSPLSRFGRGGQGVRLGGGGRRRGSGWAVILTYTPTTSGSLTPGPG
jgi:hypothetical protein